MVVSPVRELGWGSETDFFLFSAPSPEDFVARLMALGYAAR
jgi:hypothetical protein